MKSEPINPLLWHKRYDNIDGTGEMIMGAMMLGFALLGYLQTILPQESLWRSNFLASLLFMYGILVVAMGPFYWIRHLIKRHITFPRTGYVALGRGEHHQRENDTKAAKIKKARWMAFLFPAVLGGSIAAIFGLMAVIQQHYSVTWLTALGFAFYLGLFIATYAFWIWRMGGGYRWKWILFSALVLGLLIVGIRGPLDYLKLSRPILSLTGAIWMFSGVATLVAYLRRHRAPTTEEE